MPRKNDNPFIPVGFTPKQIKEAFSNVSEFEDGIVHPFRDSDDESFRKQVDLMEPIMRPFKS